MSALDLNSVDIHAVDLPLLKVDALDLPGGGDVLDELNWSPVRLLVVLVLVLAVAVSSSSSCCPSLPCHGRLLVLIPRLVVLVLDARVRGGRGL